MDSVDGGVADVASALPWDLEHVPYEFTRMSAEESIRRSREFYEQIKTRRTIRFFSSDPVPVEVIHNIIKAAGWILTVSKCFSSVKHDFFVICPRTYAYGQHEVTNYSVSDFT